MFISFLPPLGMHYDVAPYLWVMYKQMAHLSPDELAFICTDDYCRPPEEHEQAGRGDIGAKHQATTGFTIPKRAQLDAYRFALLTTRQAATDDPVAAFRAMLTEPLPDLVADLRAGIQALRRHHAIEALLTWCNCASLNLVADELGIAIIHNELGALRGPEYHGTVYFDFHGVNGATEAATRFPRFCNEPAARAAALSRAELLGLLKLAVPSVQPLHGTTAEFDTGVALQVDRDSNIVAYANAWTTDALCRDVAAIWPRSLVRKHPQNAQLPPATLMFDDSPNAGDFIARCARIVTINSSVALESMLAGKPTYVLGDAPTAFAARRHLDEDSDPLSPEGQVDQP